MYRTRDAGCVFLHRVQPQNSQGNTFDGSIFNKVATIKLINDDLRIKTCAFLPTSVFLSFPGQVFCRATLGECFLVLCFFLAEAVVRRCSVRKVFLEISQNSQKNTSVSHFFLKKSKNSFIKKRLRTAFLQNTSGGCFFPCSSKEVIED